MVDSRAADEPGAGWAFGPFELRPGRGLLRDGAKLELDARPLALLEHLVRHRDRVVPRRELAERVWPGVSVSDTAFDAVVGELRRALGDRAASPTFIATVRERGLRFIGIVRVLRADGPSTWQKAAIHFERALEALDVLERGSGRAAGGEQRERGELLVALARARWAGGSMDDARRAFLDAAAVGRAAGDADILARAALGFAGRTDVTLGVHVEAVELLQEALAALPEEDSALRSELLARLATESYYAGDPDRNRELAQMAVDMAERSGDAAVLAYDLTALHFVMQLPEVPPAERLPIDDRIFELIAKDPASDVLALALHQRALDLLELGDGSGFRRTLERLRAVSAALEQPFFAWAHSLLEGTCLLVSGDVQGAEDAAHRTLDLGQRIGTPNAVPAFAAQLFGVRRAQGRLAELVPVMDEIAESGEALPIFLVGRAAVRAAAGPERDARAAIDRAFAHDLTEHPRDQNWLAMLGTLAPPVARYGSEAQVRRVLAELEPYHDRIIVVGQGATTHGAVSHYLMLLHAALGDDDAASRWSADADERHGRLGVVPWVEQPIRARPGAPD